MAHDNGPPQQTLNIPSLVFVLLLVAFSIHYFFFSSASSSATSSAQRRNRNAADPAQIEQIASMFPQLSRRDIQWDLQRNGGSVQATTERVLSGRGLERPPPSFQPIQLPSSSTSNTTAPVQQQRASAGWRSAHPDLITRYNLEGRVSSPQQQPESADSAKEGPAWRPSKAERQSLLQKRREDMVLAARRKMEEKERERRGGGEGGGGK